MVDGDDVVWAYRLFLCREPDDMYISDHQKNAADRYCLRDNFVNSEEFARYLRAIGFERSQSASCIVSCSDVHDRPFFLNDAFFPRISDFVLCRYESAASSELASVLGTGDIFLDVGAGIGWFSLLGGECVGQSGRVYAFEPHGVTLGALKSNVEARHLDGVVTCVAVAVTDRNGYAVLEAPRRPDGRGARLAQHAFGDDLRVPTSRLDGYQFERRVTAIKINTNGGESKVLAGARNLIRTDHPCLFLPSRVPAESAELLNELGYNADDVSASGTNRDELIILHPRVH